MALIYQKDKVIKVKRIKNMVKKKEKNKNMIETKKNICI